MKKTDNNHTLVMTCSDSAPFGFAHKAKNCLFCCIKDGDSPKCLLGYNIKYHTINDQTNRKMIISLDCKLRWMLFDDGKSKSWTPVPWDNKWLEE